LKADSGGQLKKSISLIHTSAVKAKWDINGLPQICNQVSFLAPERFSDVVPIEFVRAGKSSIMCWKDPLKFLFEVT
jgi:hypothetical protein